MCTGVERAVARVQRIDAPTSLVWINGRVETRGASDYENVRAIQDRFAVTRLSLTPGFAPPPDTRDLAAVNVRSP